MNRNLSMFKDYLYPNIQENAININCSVGSEVIEKIKQKNIYQIYPIFKVSSIVFNELEFLIDLQLMDATFIEPHYLAVAELEKDKEKNTLEIPKEIENSDSLQKEITKSKENILNSVDGILSENTTDYNYGE